MTDFNRRDFLRASGAVFGAIASGRFGLSALADEKGAAVKTVVVLYMRGGADSLSLVAPYTDATYRKIRPTIAVPPPGADGGALDLGGGFGLHPSMKGLHALYKKGMFAPILNVGSPHPTRSHFDAQDFMEYAAPGVRTITEGWLNRWLTATNEGKRKEVELRALAAQPLLPRALRGQFPVLAVPEDRAMQAMDEFEGQYGKGGGMEKRSDDPADKILGAGQETIRKLRFLQDILAKADGAGGVKYPATTLGRQFQGIAQVIKAGCGLEVAAADYNGWDHHAKEGVEDGQMADMLKNVSDTLAAFAEDLGEARMKDVLVLTMSEFGRTVAENGNNGTDHGHGGIMLALGGQVDGGKIFGKWTGLEPKSLYEERDMPVHTDFRLPFTEVLSGFLGFTKMEKFFPDWKPQAPALGFLKKA
ncbi:MAG: DUF1501 domain-containing protein [Planctomycetota bacterium]